MSSRSTRSTSTRVRVSVRSTIRKTKGCHVLTILSPVRCPFDMADVGKPFGSQQRLGDISRSAANAGVLFEPHGRGFQGLLRGRRRRLAGWRLPVMESKIRTSFIGRTPRTATECSVIVRQKQKFLAGFGRSGQIGKDGHRRGTAGQPLTMEVFRDTPALPVSATSRHSRHGPIR